MFKYSFTAIAILLAQVLMAQIGTQNSYRFLNLAQSPREAALGGKAALISGDVGLALSNPALLDSSMNKHLLLQYTPYNAGINYGNVQYFFESKKQGSFSLGIQSFSYGTFTQSDATGQITGEFGASDFVLYAGHSLRLTDRFKIGMNLKLIYSNLFEYQSFGFAGDFSSHYSNEDQSFEAALIIRNIGSELVNSSKLENQLAPLDIQLGFSREVAKAPFKVFVLADNLQKWDLAYDNAALNRQGEERIFTIDKLFRHISGGVEFSPNKKFVLRGGYNYMRQQELKIQNRNGLTGFSLGLGLNLGRYRIEYGLATYHLAGTSNHLSLHTDLGKMKKRRKSS